MTKIFFDTEFTGLHQKTTLISIGLIADSGESFYAELTDYDKNQIDDWLKENVINNLTNTLMLHKSIEEINGKTRVYGDMEYLKLTLSNWISKFESIEIWSDCLAYDWVLFCQIFGHAFNIPKNIYYIPYDTCTLFHINGINPDINREKFALGEAYAEMPKHNALWDAEIIMKCYNKLTEN